MDMKSSCRTHDDSVALGYEVRLGRSMGKNLELESYSCRRRDEI